jgi:hypothetical protein
MLCSSAPGASDRAARSSPRLSSGRASPRPRSFFMLYGILGLVHFILFLIAAFEILNSGKSLGNKLLWLLVIFLFPLVGLVIYFLMGRKA